MISDANQNAIEDADLSFILGTGIHEMPFTVAGRRWTMGENFQASKGLTGLDHHQVRR